MRRPVLDKHLFDSHSWLPVLKKLTKLTFIVKEPYEEEEERFGCTTYDQGIEAWEKMLAIFLSYIDANVGNRLPELIWVDWEVSRPSSQS